MANKNIVIAAHDYKRLRSLISSSRQFRQRDTQHLDELEQELDRATIADTRVPHGIVTMNSRVRVRDLASGHEFTYEIVFPRDADVARNRISVLAPIGTAFLGYGAGAIVQWRVPAGLRRWRILDVQPPRAASGAAA